MKTRSAINVAEIVSREDIRGAVARGWCHPENEHKVMDSDLALAIADEVTSLLNSHKLLIRALSGKR